VSSANFSDSREESNAFSFLSALRSPTSWVNANLSASKLINSRSIRSIFSLAASNSAGTESELMNPYPSIAQFQTRLSGPSGLSEMLSAGKRNRIIRHRASLHSTARRPDFYLSCLPRILNLLWSRICCSIHSSPSHK